MNSIIEYFKGLSGEEVVLWGCVLVMIIVGSIAASISTRHISKRDSNPATAKHGIRTAHHDDHLWAYTSNHFTHHPDCPCKETP